jgi:hypothetical protein
MTCRPIAGRGAAGPAPCTESRQVTEARFVLDFTDAPLCLAPLRPQHRTRRAKPVLRICQGWESNSPVVRAPKSNYSAFHHIMENALKNIMILYGEQYIHDVFQVKKFSKFVCATRTRGWIRRRWRGPQVLRRFGENFRRLAASIKKPFRLCGCDHIIHLL